MKLAGVLTWIYLVGFLQMTESFWAETHEIFTVTAAHTPFFRSLFVLQSVRLGFAEDQSRRPISICLTHLHQI